MTAIVLKFARRGQLGGNSDAAPGIPPQPLPPGVRVPRTSSGYGLVPYPDGGPGYFPGQTSLSSGGDCGCGCNGKGDCKPKAVKVVIPAGASPHRIVAQLGAALGGGTRNVSGDPPEPGPIPLACDEGYHVETDATGHQHCVQGQTVGYLGPPIQAPANGSPCRLPGVPLTHGLTGVYDAASGTCKAPLTGGGDPAGPGDGLLDGSVHILGHEIPKTYLLVGGLGIGFVLYSMAGGSKR
jgi:hypothetical protein